MPRRKSANGAILSLTALAAAAASAAGQEPDVPAFLLGDFVDDYGIVYSVSERQWEQGRASRYDITHWNVAGRYFVARNHPGNPGEPGLWTRVDWVELDDASGYAWAYCYAIYDAETQEEAVAAAPSGRDSPRTGCNGHPFSRMTRGSPVRSAS